METKNLAIMLTDIKGFTDRTSKQSRSQMMDLLARHKELVLPVVHKYKGRLVKSIGDAFLVVFESPTDAVLCGVEIQGVLRKHNEGKGPDERIEVRVAINSGEITVAEDGDIFGEPVNVTARLEGIAEVGQVFFTEAVYLAMNKKEVPASEIGYRQFKGIPEKVKVYRVLRERPVGRSEEPQADALAGTAEQIGESLKGFQKAVSRVLDQVQIPETVGTVAARGEEKEGAEGRDEEPEKILFSCELTYALSDPSGTESVSGEADSRLGTERLSILPRFGEPLSLPYRDILEFSEGDYRVQLSLTSGEGLSLSSLGYRYEDFIRVFSKLRNELFLKDSLMNEALKKSGAEAEYVRSDESGRELGKGACEPRLYETGLVIVPEKGCLARIPLSDIREVRVEDYALKLTTEYGEGVVLSKMGNRLDDFSRALSDAMNALSLKVQSELKALVPDADPSVIRRAARLMKEGRAAKKADLDAVSPKLWTELEKRLEAAGLKETYDFLKTLGQKERLCIGMKRGLMGDLTGDYLWFLVPVYGRGKDAPGNAVAMEAASGEGGGRATYFFRIAGRKEYAGSGDIEALHKEADAFIGRLNRCMLEINFRREPVYLPDERLEEPQYQKVKFAVQKLPALRTLRSLFIGRVVHANQEQWKRDVMDLLKFNAAATDDGARWEKK